MKDLISGVVSDRGDTLSFVLANAEEAPPFSFSFSLSRKGFKEA